MCKSDGHFTGLISHIPHMRPAIRKDVRPVVAVGVALLIALGSINRVDQESFPARPPNRYPKKIRWDANRV